MAMNFEKYSRSLYEHDLYNFLDTLNHIRIFMEFHIFAVWDFMSLLKSLQQKLTCVSLPWRPVTQYPSYLTRFINEIVLCEESDKDDEGHYNSHFSIYLMAMNQIGARTETIKKYIATGDKKFIPEPIRSFVLTNIKISQSDDIIKIAATFLYGREKIIPGMFSTLLSVLENNNIKADKFKFYLARHIEIDADEHAPMAKKFLDYLCSGDNKKKSLAQIYAIESIKQRIKFWDSCLEYMKG